MHLQKKHQKKVLDADKQQIMRLIADDRRHILFESEYLPAWQQ